MAEQLFAERIIGGRGPRLDEPLITTTYVSVFITHFLGNTSENREVLRKLYLDFDLSSYQIADLSGYSRTAISDFLRREAIKKSKRKSPTPRFGERLAAGGLRVPHLAEQKIIEKIVRLKNQGKSFRKIAEFLNSTATPSKRGGQWSKTTVQDVYNRHEEGKK